MNEKQKTHRVIFSNYKKQQKFLQAMEKLWGDRVVVDDASSIHFAAGDGIGRKKFVVKYRILNNSLPV